MSTGALLRRATRGSTALRGGRVRRLTPYQVFGLLFWLLMTLAYWRVPPCCEAGQHAAAVARLRAGLTGPAVSPYVLAQGALARLTGLSGWQLLRVCGPLHLLVLLTGLGRLVRVLTPRPWAPVLALAFLSVLWGTRPAWGGGSLALLPLTGSLGYPSALALGLAFWAWALTGARARDLRRVRYVGPSGLRSLSGYAALGLLYGAVALLDPTTGLGAAAGAVAFTAGWQRGWRGAVWGRWALMCAAATTVLVLATHARALPPPPYGPPAGMTAVTGLTWPAGRTGSGGWTGLADRCWLALLGVPALWLRARRAVGGPSVCSAGGPAGSQSRSRACEAAGPVSRRWGRGAAGVVRGSADVVGWRDPLVLMFLLECLVLVGGGLVGVLGLVLVAPQCALAVELAARRPWPRWRRALGWATAGGVCLGFLTAQAGAVVPRSVDPVGFVQPPRWPSYDWAARHIGPREPVLTDAYYAVRLLPGYGIELTDGHDHRPRVRWLLLTRRERLPAGAVVVDWSRRTGEVLARLTRTGTVPARSAGSTR
ncbi:hypothetical protein ACIRQQ_09845 [Streptomyces fuscichromogenes]|uniref:hypothetical protein n=1 Tax=Streptomyces fuscichromogenes TaxID=1324013 RepID=UPI0037FF539C